MSARILVRHCSNDYLIFTRSRTIEGLSTVVDLINDLNRFYDDKIYIKLIESAEKKK